MVGQLAGENDDDADNGQPVHKEVLEARGEVGAEAEGDDGQEGEGVGLGRATLVSLELGVETAGNGREAGGDGCVT